MPKPKKGYARAAAKAPGWVRHIKTTKWSAKKQRGYRNRKLGKMGAASMGRYIVKDGVPVDA